jgi:hypothetical protein
MIAIFGLRSDRGLARPQAASGPDEQAWFHLHASGLDELHRRSRTLAAAWPQKSLGFASVWLA